MRRCLYRLIVGLIGLTVRSGRSKDLEIIVLRHQLAVLRRQNPRPAIEDDDRTLLDAVAQALPRRLRLGWIITPDTLLRWHRRRVVPLIGAVPSLDFTGMDWVIVGGESGHGARPLDLAWVIDVWQRSTEAGAAFFLKQLVSVWARENGYRGKAHDMDQWPEQLRMRDMPVLGVAPVGDLLAG